ncbi:hypothetical protein GGF46_000010 [Coemansia sp. RSA 552]|nr:hypothetical protein GGF46_000010 [Coemansia sp. RSA 552]
MQTRGARTPSKAAAPSTPTTRRTASGEQGTGGVSARLRSRARSSQSEEEAAEPQTPTTARGRRSTMRPSASGSDDQSEAPGTPTRRSTRTAAARANSLLHETPGLVSGRRRATPVRKTSSAQSSGDDAPLTPTRRTRVGARTPNAAAAGSLLSPRRLVTRRSAAASSSEDDSLEAQMPPIMSPTPSRRVVRQPATPRSTTAARTPGKAAAAATEASKTPSRAAAAAEAKKTPTRRGRATRTLAQQPKDESDSKADSELPPAHPDLRMAAKALAELSCTGGSKKSALSSRQSADESFQTAPESPEKQSPTGPARVALSSKSSQIHTAVSAALAAAEDAVKELEEKVEDGDISDLSDVEDPHFTELMTAEAESATMSAAESIAGSVVGGDSDREDDAAPSKRSHIRFDPDAEASSSDDDDDDDGKDGAQVPIRQNQAVAAPSDDSDSDEAPEIVTTKAAAHVANDKTTAMDTDADEAVVPGEAKTASSKSKKSRRSRQRKRAAEAAAQATKDMKAALDTSKQRLQNSIPGQLPSTIPSDLRLSERDIKLPKSEDAAQAASDEGEGRLDASVLEEAFGGDSSGGKDGEKRKKRKHVRVAEDGGHSSKRHKKDGKKSKKDRQSRVVSGIRVVATKPASAMSLIESLSRDVSPRVRKFIREKHGGSRVKRSVPIDGIAKRNGQPSINFFR